MQKDIKQLPWTRLMGKGWIYCGLVASGASIQGYVASVCSCELSLRGFPLQLRTFLGTILMGNPNGFLDWFGVVCSSWISMAKGTTHRSQVLPHGHMEYRSVSDGNMMAARFLA